MNIIEANKHYYQRSGADRYIFGLTDLLESHGHNVIPFAMQHRENRSTPWSKYFPPYVQTRQPKLSLDGLKTFKRMIYSREAKCNMAALIRDARPDLAHIHNIYTQLSPSILDALSAAKVPTVMTVHDYHLVAPNYSLWAHGKIEDWSQPGLVRSTLSKFHKNSYAASFAQSLMFKLHRQWKIYQKNIDHFIPPSEFVRQRMIESGFEADKITTIPHFIDLSGVEPKKEEDDEGYVLFVGRFVEEKGAEVLIRAMSELPDVPCKLLGAGPDEGRLRDWAAGHGNIEFLGWQKGGVPWDLYRKARVVVVPSIWYEVFGLVALEAMAVGTPVIASEIGGLTEVVDDGQTGRLVPPGDVQALKMAIEDMMDNKKHALELGRAGRTKVETEYSPELHYEQIIKVFQSVL